MESLFVLSPRFFLDDPTMFEPVDEVGGAMGVDLKRSSLGRKEFHFKTYYFIFYLSFFKIIFIIFYHVMVGS